MPGRRGARTGRGWDAAPPRPARTRRQPPRTGTGWAAAGPDEALWGPDEADYLPGTPRGDQHDPEPSDDVEWDPSTGEPRPAGEAWAGPEQLTGPPGEAWPQSEGQPGEARPGRSERRSGQGQRAGQRRGRQRADGDVGERSAEQAGDQRSDRRAGDGRRTGRWGPPAPVDETRDPAEVAREICLRQLSVRPRTRLELAAALARNGIDAEVAAQVLDRYDEVGIIDDAAFARAWVNSRHHGRGLASRALAGELRRKGVDKELADAALDELDDETEAATARDLVDRKLRAAGNATPDALFRRLVGMLARKGYPPGMAIRVVKEALSARTDESGFLDSLDPDAAEYLIGDESGGERDGDRPND